MADDNVSWRRLRNLLADYHAEQLIVCPLSYEHLLETAGRHNQSALDQHNFLTSLSSGYCLRVEEEITAQLLISSVRKNNTTANTFMTNKLSSAYSYGNNLDNLRAAKKDHQSAIDGKYEMYNVINEGSNKSHNKPEAVRFTEVLRRLEVDGFVSRLRELLKRGKLETGTRGSTPTHYDIIIRYLVKKNKMVTQELKSLISYLHRKGFKEISTLNTRSTLHIHAATSHRKHTANDDIDMSRIGTAIQISDIMLLDKSRKNQLIETGLDQKYSIRLYSGTANDLSDLISLLDVA